jgi:hypothetical protein
MTTRNPLRSFLFRYTHYKIKFQKSNITSTPKPTTLFWLRCVHGTWVAGGNTRPPHGHHWHLIICTIMVPRLASRPIRNRCELSAARRWQLSPSRCLLQIAFHSVVSSGAQRDRMFWNHTANRPSLWLGGYEIPFLESRNTWNTLRRTWLGNDLQKTRTWSKPVPSS